MAFNKGKKMIAQCLKNYLYVAGNIPIITP